MKVIKIVVIPALLLSVSAFAEEQSYTRNAFLVDMTHAYYASLGELCPATSLNVQGLFAAGMKAGLGKDDVVEIENAILQLNGNTKVALPSKKVAGQVAFASTMINVDISKGEGKQNWCDFRVPKLIDRGMLIKMGGEE